MDSLKQLGSRVHRPVTPLPRRRHPQLVLILIPAPSLLGRVAIFINLVRAHIAIQPLGIRCHVGTPSRRAVAQITDADVGLVMNHQLAYALFMIVIPCADEFHATIAAPPNPAPLLLRRFGQWAQVQGRREDSTIVLRILHFLVESCERVRVGGSDRQIQAPWISYLSACRSCRIAPCDCGRSHCCTSDGGRSSQCSCPYQCR